MYLGQHRNDVVMVHQMRISNKMLNNRRCLDRYRMHIHSPVTRVELLNTTTTKKNNNNFISIYHFLTTTIKLSESYDRVFVHHNQQPNCNCNDCARLLCHQIANHFRMFLMLMFHLYTKKIDRSCLDVHMPVHHTVLDTEEQLHRGLENQE